MPRKAAESAPAPAAPSVNSRVLVAVGVVIALIIGFTLGRKNDGNGTSNPSGGSTTSVSLPTNMLEVALQFHNQGRLDDAVRAYNAVLSVDPTNKFAFYNLGVIAQGRQQYDVAIENYTKTLALDDTFNPARYNRGLAYRDTDKVDLAVTDLQGVIKADPKNASAMYNLGQIYIKQGRATEGSKLVTDALVINPGLAQG